jgi:hypothetical protein
MEHICLHEDWIHFQELKRFTMYGFRAYWLEYELNFYISYVCALYLVCSMTHGRYKLLSSSQAKPRSIKNHGY